MSRQGEFGFITAFHDELTKEIEQRGYDDIYTKAEDTLINSDIWASGGGTFLDSNVWTSGRGTVTRRADIVVYKRRESDIPELDSMEAVSRWFPEKAIDIPILEIHVKREPVMNWIVRDMSTLSPGDGVLRGVVAVQSDWMDVDVEIEASENHFLAMFPEDETIAGSKLIDYVLKRIEEKRDAQILSQEELRERISDFDPSVFHFEEVLHAYREDRQKILIVLLSVFFEGYIETLAEDTLESLRQRDFAGAFYSDLTFEENLEACRFFGTLSEDEFRIIDKIRAERNDFAHDSDKYHADYKSQVVEDGTLEDAIELYEDIIGVRKSMLD